jgi:hypothetical protein
MIISLDGVRVITPGEPGHGQYYPSYCQQWMEWLVSNNPESNNYGPVFFLHCVSPCQYYGAQTVVRIGPQAISINAGSYVFLPIITAAAETIDSGVQDNPSALLNYVRMDLEAGDNPPHPDQAGIIDATNIDQNDQNTFEPIVDDLDPYLVVTDVFPLDVPPAQSGSRLLRTCFDIPIDTPGVRNCRVGGYWILMCFSEPGRKYYIRSFARGRPPYQSGMLYEINVSESKRTRKTDDQVIKDIKRTNDKIVGVVDKLSDDKLIDSEDKKILKNILRDK